MQSDSSAASREEVMGTDPETYATAQEMAAKYKISTDTVRRKVNTGAWPCDQIGRLYRFSPEQQRGIALGLLELLRLILGGQQAHKWVMCLNWTVIPPSPLMRPW